LSGFYIFARFIKRKNKDFTTEGKELVFHPVFKTGSRRITPAVAGSIPALSAKQLHVPILKRKI
jgi:hypothetical protein